MALRSTLPLSLVVAAGAAAPAFAQTTPPRFANPVPGITLGPGPRYMGTGVEVADVNGDGLNDLVFQDNDGSPPYAPSFGVALNLGAGSFAEPIRSIAITDGSDFLDVALALGDLNEDGVLDLVTTYLSMVYPTDGNRPNLAVLFGTPDGRFINQINLANSTVDRFMGRARGRNIAIGDMNGDGRPDIVSPASTNTYSVLPGNGDGTFGPPIQSGSGAAEIMLLADADGDGDLDIASVVNSGTDSRAKASVYIQLNDGSGVLTQANVFTLDARTNIVHTGEPRAYFRDLDNDGFADFILFGEHGSQSGAGGLYVLKGNGDGTFTTKFRETRGQDQLRTATIVIEDFDGDGDIDIAKVPNGGEMGHVLINDGSASFPTLIELPYMDTSYFVGGAAGDVSGSGLPEIVFYDQPYGGPPSKLRWAENITPLPCPADFTGDGLVDFADYLDFLNLFDAQDPRADLTHDGVIDFSDYLEFLNRYDAGC